MLTLEQLEQAITVLRQVRADQAHAAARLTDLIAAFELERARAAQPDPQRCHDCGRAVDESDSRLDTCTPPHRLCRACDRWSKRDPQPTPEHVRCDICACWVSPAVLAPFACYQACNVCRAELTKLRSRRGAGHTAAEAAARQLHVDLGLREVRG